MCPKEFTSRSVTVRVFIFIFIMTLFSFQDCQQRCSLLSYQLMIRGTAEIFGDIWRGQIWGGKTANYLKRQIKKSNFVMRWLQGCSLLTTPNICGLELALRKRAKVAGPVRSQNLFSSKPLYLWTINCKSSSARNDFHFWKFHDNTLKQPPEAASQIYVPDAKTPVGAVAKNT